MAKRHDHSSMSTRDPGDVDVETPWYRGPAAQLLAVLLGVYGVGAFVGAGGIGTHLINFLTVVVVLLGLRQITRDRRVLVGALILLGVLLAASSVFVEATDEQGYIWDEVSQLVFFTFVFFVLLQVSLRKERVTADKIFAAAATYVIMGICWGIVYSLLHILDPGAFSLTAADLDEPRSALIHFSFTTLTTVGYGNISPLSRAARALSDLESVIAQLYLAVVVARLVALQISDSGTPPPALSGGKNQR